MHAPFSHPRHPLVLGLFVLVFALLVMAAAAPDLGTLDFSIGGDTASTSQAPPAIPTNPEVTPAAGPTWVSDPLAAPLEQLAGAR